MTERIKLSKIDARQFILNCQGLVRTFPTPLEVVQQLGYIQIDTISVIERAHHHVLFTRQPQYKAADLDRLMAEKQVFEYWAHAAAYLPMSDFRFSLISKGEFSNGKRHWFEKDKKIMRHVLKRIKEEGPLQSKDFANPSDKRYPWYEWKPAKMALTELFMEGKLMVAGRQGFQKVFDLTERVLPDGVDLAKPTKTEFCKHLIQRSVQAHGMVTSKEVTYLRSGLKPTMDNVLKGMVKNGALTPVEIEGITGDYYSTEKILRQKGTIETKPEVHILSPFDNLIIQRKRIKEFFDFDYQIECYVPEKKRQYGYFCLPVVYGHQFVARFDPKADRKAKTFHIKGFWLEPTFKPSEDFYAKFSMEVLALASFCGCDEIQLDRKISRDVLVQLKEFIH